jgi:hypothetical protein
MPIGLELCNFCKHWSEEGDCAAFPGQIPLDVFYGRHDHRDPYPGDHGIRFELAPDLSPEMLSAYRRHHGQETKEAGRPEPAA